MAHLERKTSSRKHSHRHAGQLALSRTCFIAIAGLVLLLGCGGGDSAPPTGMNGDSGGSMETPPTETAAPSGENPEETPTTGMPSEQTPPQGETTPSGETIPSGETPPSGDVDTEMTPVSDANFPEIGSTEFETAVEEAATATSNVNRATTDAAFGGGAGGTTAPGATAADPADTSVAMDPAVTADPNAAATATREILEADIVQMDGDILYVLNSYRGLVLIDMSDPDRPFVSGRVPFQATPVDMYLKDGRAYVVMSDYFTYWQFDDDADPLGFHGSRILVVDVEDPANPTAVGGYNVSGEVTDTRIVGDVLYAVSHRNPEYWRYDTADFQDTTWVLSINIADPENIQEVDREEFPGAAQIIQVFPTAISIAALDPNYYLVDADNGQETLLTYVDISDPAGEIHVGGSVYVPGMVADKFKMDLDGDYLRVMSNNWYWQPDSPATLSVFDVSNRDELQPAAEIEIDGSNPSDTPYVRPQATRFDQEKFFVNLCWSELVDTRYTTRCRIDSYDLSAPDAPEKVGSVPVVGQVTHFETRGDRLLALGSHIADTTTWQSQVRLELFDISDLTAPRSLSSADLGELSSSSNALSDYKALKILEDLDMILLPLGWNEVTGQNPTTGQDIITYFQGAQIVDWVGDTLTERGRLAQDGAVERAIAFQDRVVSISDRQVQVIDAGDRDNPFATANLFLVRNVIDLFNIEGYQVELGYDEEDTSFRFFVLPFGEDDLANSLAELPVPNNLYYHLRSGDTIRLFGYDPTSGQQIVQNVDFSDPMNPEWRGELLIPPEIGSIVSPGNYYGYWGYYYYYWYNLVGKSLNNDLFPVLVRNVESIDDGRRFFINVLQIADLSDIDNPRITDAAIEFPDFPFINRVTHGDKLYSVHTEPALDQNGNPKQYHVRYFMDRVDVSDPDDPVLLNKVNIPGQLVDVDDSGTILYTVDYQWDEHGRRRNSFNVLSLSGDTATLLGVLPVGDEIGRARYLDREVWLSSHRYPWYGLNVDTPDSRQPYTRLTKVTVDDNGVVNDEYTDVWGYHFNLLDIEDDTAYLSTSYPNGLLVLDVSDMAATEIVSAARSVGYVSKIVKHEDALYMPMGPYGVRRTSLQ